MKAIRVFLVGIIALAGAGACAIGTAALPTPQSMAETTIQLAPAPSAQPRVTATSVFTINESDLNRQLAQSMASAEISNARVDFHTENLADFSATLRNGNLTLEPRVSIKLSVRDGRIVIDVLQVAVSGLPVPSNLIEPQIAQIKQSAEAEMNRQITEIRSNTGLTLQSLSTAQDSLTLYFAP